MHLMSFDGLSEDFIHSRKKETPENRKIIS
jgi:hypothetical protein